MKKLLALLILSFCISESSGQSYFPSRDNWERTDPKEFDISGSKLDEAIAFAEENEYSGSRDLRIAILEGFRREPFHDVLGPTKKRGGPAGLIIKNGYIIGEWGEVEQVDMTFSVTKSYLSTVAGLAIDEGLIGDVHDKVYEYVWDGTFDGDHNQTIEWHHLLNQSSAWRGEFLGLKDWADRPPREGGIDDWSLEPPVKPGTVMEYNDVRVNVLAYSLLHVWRKPLPMVLKEKVMDPIGASTTWRWFGYDHAWTTIDGVKVKTVTGGGHSGGGIFINTLDHARFGLLFLNNGNWADKQIISENWVKTVQQPSKAMESYGYMWWLNRGPRKWEQVENENIYYAAGFGGNFIVIDESNDLVIVTRWLEPTKIGEFVGKVLAAMN